MKQHLSEAVCHLASALLKHSYKESSDIKVRDFLTKLTDIVMYRNQANLPAWDRAVLSLFSDSEWTAFEKRSDFPLLEQVWEVGRSNLYGNIEVESTQNLYTIASNMIIEHMELEVLDVEHFDLSEW